MSTATVSTVRTARYEWDQAYSENGESELDHGEGDRP